MISQKRILLYGLPALAAVMLLSVVVSRRPASVPTDASPRKKSTPSATSPSASVPVRPRVSQIPAPPEAVVQTSDEALFRGTYDNYRTAVVTGNAAARQSLEPMVRRKSELAMRFAQEELDAAKTESDREIALKTLDALRRSP